MGDVVLQLIPWLLISGIFIWIAARFCKRKGKDLVYAWICIIPGVAFFVLLWLASLTDKQVLDRLAALETRSGT
jgi:hypothetical protein